MALHLSALCTGYVSRARGHQILAMRTHLPALDRGRMDAAYGALAEIEAPGLDLLEVRQLVPEARSPERGDTYSP